MAKSELFTDHGVFFGFFLRSCGVFPVKRSSADTSAVDRAEKLISKGRVVGIFPQGKVVRDKTCFEPKAGASLLSAKSGVSLLPVFIDYGGRVRPFKKIRITIGDPLKAEGSSLKDARAMNRQLKEQYEKIMNGRDTIEH